MKKLNKIESILFMLGGMLMVTGIGCYVFMLAPSITCWLVLTGSILFSTLHMMQAYEGSQLAIKRLKRILNIADLLFVIAGILIVDSTYNFLRPAFENQESYITYVYNKWVLLLLIAAILEVYATHRIDYLLKKQGKDTH
ncbi:hypothetical protein [Segatella oulorum]|uniref:hypothetical protein n=1 Tax=Segatella oulorum TaxID=28136 RepID=UPI0036161A22